MPRFLTSPIVENIDGKTWIVHKPFIYETELFRVLIDGPEVERRLIKGPTKRHSLDEIERIRKMAKKGNRQISVEEEMFQITVEEGFDTDFASIPRFAHRVFPKNGLHDWGAIIHDWLYRVQVVSKEIADSTFYEGMILHGVSNWRASVMYRAVDLCGDKAWNDRRRANEERRAKEAAAHAGTVLTQ